mgnify:CR=1 FL=1
MAYTTINNGSLFMNPKIYTGNGGTQTITDVNFEPDLIVTKGRDLGESPWWTDKVVGLTKYRYSDGGAADSTYTTAVTGTNSDGYVLGNQNGFNNNTNTFVSWNWKANGAGSANTDGSINSTVSVNATSGFSIVKWSGSAGNATIGHGLGAVPKMIIIKNLSDAYYWVVYHQATGNTAYTRLNTEDASSSSLNMFQNTTPTSSVFSLTSQGYVNGGGGNQMIAYCFADVQGFSKMGSYVGNGSADGTFVYTGFKPAFVMAKRSNSASSADWNIRDNKRSPINVASQVLQANLSSVEGTASGTLIDIYSNGFKPRSSGSGVNAGSSLYIYMAFAEAPLVGTNNVPANAR